MPPGDGPLVLVSSQHAVMSGPAYDAYHGIASHYASPQSLRERLGADALVHVPHDLSEPVVALDVPFLRLFDLFAAPDESTWWAGGHVRTVVTGWVGSAGGDEVPADAPVERGVLFLAQVRWTIEQGGAPFVLRTLARTLESGVAVKLPVWPGLDAFAGELERAGVPVLDPAIGAWALARRTPLVVCNGPTSVLAEANLAGHRPVCVLPAEGDAEFAGQLGALDAVVCRDEEFPERVGEAGLVREPRPPFDVDGFLAAIAATLQERARA